MKIKLAKRGGFCMGVRRAVDMALDLQRSSAKGPIVTYGPLIHNPQTLRILEARGICQVDDIDRIREGAVIIRAHGVSPQEKQELEDRGVGIIDATCPRVASVQSIIRKHSEKGRFCVIVGDEDHPEVRGLVGFAMGRAAVISEPDRELIERLVPKETDIFVVAQTTQEVEVYEKVATILTETRKNVYVFNTICDSTRKRQAEVKRMAEQSDLIVVVGGKGSGNTRRLAQVAQAHGAKALHIETEAELDALEMGNPRWVCVTAGASTPNWQIRRVTDKLKRISMNRRAGFPVRLRRAIDISVMTYFWAALGGGGLSAACLLMQERAITGPKIAMTMLFVFSMHLLNRVQDRSGAARFNTPEIADFYSRQRALLVTLGLLSCLGSLVLAYSISWNTLLMITAMTLLARIYATILVSGGYAQLKGPSSLRDIPGAKTPLVAIGWGLATAALPIVEAPERSSLVALTLSFLFSSGMVFWRTEFSDLLDIQGDRIVGRETIPILIGIENTRSLLKYFLLFLAVIPVIGVAVSAFPLYGLGLLLSVTAYFIIFRIYSMSHLVDRLFFEGIADGVLVLAGVSCIALSWL
jgi:4-hydroxy-3-methylbut-2-enyl diphosphate reductase